MLISGRQHFQDEIHHDAPGKVTFPERLGQGGEIPDPFATPGCAAEALHGEGVFFHRGRIIVTDFLSSADFPQGHEVLVLPDASVGFAGMVDEYAGRLGVNVSVRTDLDGHAFLRAAPFGFSKINDGPHDGQNVFSRCKIATGKHAQADVTSPDVELSGRVARVQPPDVRR